MSACKQPLFCSLRLQALSACFRSLTAWLSPSLSCRCPWLQHTSALKLCATIHFASLTAAQLWKPTHTHMHTHTLANTSPSCALTSSAKQSFKAGSFVSLFDSFALSLCCCSFSFRSQSYYARERAIVAQSCSCCSRFWLGITLNRIRVPIRIQFPLQFRFALLLFCFVIATNWHCATASVPFVPLWLIVCAP